MDIRPTTAADWRVYRDIRLRSLADSPDAFLSTLERDLAFGDDIWRNRAASGNTLIALDGDTAVGTATLIEDRHETGGREVVGMWVAPDHRRAGVALAMLQQFTDRARREGARAIALWVAEGNETARLVYQRAGFSPTGERESMRKGKYEVRMRRSLVD
jgi:RimJ/RimL family protein N-acetyltransferase